MCDTFTVYLQLFNGLTLHIQLSDDCIVFFPNCPRVVKVMNNSPLLRQCRSKYLTVRKCMFNFPMVGPCMSNCPMVILCISSFRMVGHGQSMSNCPMHYAKKKRYLLANPGKARACSTNTSVTRWFIHSLILQFKYLYGAVTPKQLKMVLAVIKQTILTFFQRL